jgi:hypothetical protein
MKMKFVTFRDYHGEQIIVFPAHMQHAEFSRAVCGVSYGDMEPIAGGFVLDGECVGHSVSLGMSARPQDTELLKTLLGGDEELTDEEMGIERSTERTPTFSESYSSLFQKNKTSGKPPVNSLTKNQRKRLNKKK